MNSAEMITCLASWSFNQEGSFAREKHLNIQNAASVVVLSANSIQMLQTTENHLFDNEVKTERFHCFASFK